jgi:teichuronic acid biosynthesis glycosyltransferase TuaH
MATATPPIASCTQSSAILRPRLTLVTHVDWGHIRQRPHQLASALSSDFDVTVLAPVSRKRSNLVANPAPGVAVERIWRLPGSFRSTNVASANAVLASLQCGPWIRRADVVVVTSPELWPWVEPSVDARTLVYDCMDDALAFAQDDGVRELKTEWETRLFKRANVVVCSSEELSARCASRGATRIVTIPNGWDDRRFPVAPAAAFPRSGPLEFVYFGTLGPWIDDAALRTMLATVPEASIRLIGPLDGADLSGLVRTRVEPPVEHSQLGAVTATADALLLPFRVDDLTRAVDPVKLYEYVAMGKPIVSAFWPGIRRFAEYVTFYQNSGELAEVVRARRIRTPPDTVARAEFLRSQSWSMRAAAFTAAVQRSRMID